MRTASIISTLFFCLGLWLIFQDNNVQLNALPLTFVIVGLIAKEVFVMLRVLKEVETIEMGREATQAANTLRATESGQMLDVLQALELSEEKVQHRISTLSQEVRLLRAQLERPPYRRDPDAP